MGRALQMIELQAASQDLLWNSGPVSRLLPGQAEIFQNMLISMSSDWRVVTLILAHHLNQLTLRVESGEPRSRDSYVAAREALDVFAPLAQRLGIFQLKDKLENLGFRHLYPLQHKFITEELAKNKVEQETLLSEQMLMMKRYLQEDEVFMNNIRSVVVEGRTKSPYSTWRKLMKSSVEHGMNIFQFVAESKGSPRSMARTKVFDAIGIRVVFDVDPVRAQVDPSVPKQVRERGEALAYHVLDMVHNRWAHMDFRVKDYVSAPKANGYQSLHTTAMVRYHGASWPFEVQIRTQDMHRVAEWGKAAHYRYTQQTWEWLLCGGSQSESGASDEAEAEEADATPDIDACNSPVEYATWLHDELKENRVYVFNSQGRLLDLERGMTAADALRQNLIGTTDAGEALRPVLEKALGRLRTNGRVVSSNDFNQELRNGYMLQH